MIDEDDDIELAQGETEAQPANKSRPSKQWLAMVDAQERAGFEDWQQRCTNIEKQYADLDRLASVGRDRQFQVFWANIQVLQPSMYAQPPVPVVVPRFRDRNPLKMTTAEFLERSTASAFAMEDMDLVMRHVRDDLSIIARGCIWVRYEAKGENDNFAERICIEHKNRRDFIHDPAREWKEVDWVAGGCWMSRKEMRKRFSKTSGKAYQDAAFTRRKDDRNKTDGKLKARVWEIWCKSENKVVWVSPGVDVVLDEDEPHLTLEGFFPCPRPAYGTLQRDSLVPVPDFLYYKDQLEEVNELTNRISALAESLRVKGFYPAGAGEISDAVQAAVKTNNDRQILVPVSNWAAFGNGAAKDTIVWLPLDQVVAAITQLIALRKQIIEDIYQISGLSDVMRGATNPRETLGAQTLKTQYGSVRIRDRQSELVRIARDTARIVAEIMAENFTKDTLLDMSQMEFPTEADISKDVKGLEQQQAEITAEIQGAQKDPEIMRMAQQNPQKAQQVLEQAQAQVQQIGQQIAKLKETVTIEKVMKLLRDQRLRAFSLDIETDSTIQADENAEKQRRAEFLTALGGVMAQLAPMVQQRPETASFAAEIIKFAVAPYRPGRSMEGAIDEFVEKLEALGQQQRPDQNAEAERQAAEAKAKQQDAQNKASLAKQESDARVQAIGVESQAKQRESEIRIQQMAAKRDEESQKHQQDMQTGALQLEREKVNLGKARVDAEAATRQAAITAVPTLPTVTVP